MIELRNLSAGYGGENVIEGLCLEIKKGELLSLIGVNGSGKSTILKAVSGIIEKTSGEILLDGKNVRDFSRRDFAKRVAYLSQSRSVADMTAEQMVLHGRFPHLDYPRRYGKKDRDIARRAMEQMGIFEISKKPLADLSGGTRQKVYLAMALAQDSDYILLDEPTTYLDIGGQLELMNALKDLAKCGKGIVLVMHDLPLAFGYSDKIAMIKDKDTVIFDVPEKVAENVREVFGVGIENANGVYHYNLK